MAVVGDKAITNMENSQGALLLLRQCAGFAKLVYSMRTGPPSTQTKRSSVPECLPDQMPAHQVVSPFGKGWLGPARSSTRRPAAPPQPVPHWAKGCQMWGGHLPGSGQRSQGAATEAEFEERPCRHGCGLLGHDVDLH